MVNLDLIYDSAGAGVFSATRCNFKNELFVHWLRRSVQISCCVAFISMQVDAQQSSPLKQMRGPDSQNWDELDVLTRLSSHLDARWIMQTRFSSQLPNPATYVLGTDFNFDVSKHLVITPSYYYFTFRSISGAKGHGHDPILGATLFSKHGALTISDRNRFIGVLDIAGTRDFWVYW
jgi:hypothetical protein